MPMLYKAWPCLLILALAAGCATPSVVNLTPGSLPPSESGFYRIEMAWEGRPGVVKDSVRPVLMVGQEDYPMEAVPLTEGRWETLIPFPEGRREIHYQYKIGVPGAGVRQGGGQQPPLRGLPAVDRALAGRTGSGSQGGGQLLLEVHQLFDLRQEPRVDPGQLVDLPGPQPGPEGVADEVDPLGVGHP